MADYDTYQIQGVEDYTDAQAQEQAYEDTSGATANAFIATSVTAAMTLTNLIGCGGDTVSQADYNHLKETKDQVARDYDDEVAKVGIRDWTIAKRDTTIKTGKDSIDFLNGVLSMKMDLAEFKYLLRINALYSALQAKSTSQDSVIRAVRKQLARQTQGSDTLATAVGLAITQIGSLATQVQGITRGLVGEN